VLDGDALRIGISDDLGFGALERSENVRRAAHIAKLFNDTGLIVIVAMVSPFEADRAEARAIIGEDRFREVHVTAEIDIDEALARLRALIAPP
jgi:adenylylsulfate kinase